MTTKQAILSLLEQNRANPISGEEIASKLGISRAAVSKAVSSLKASGHKITAVTNKGYTLCVDSDIIDSEIIKKYLSPALLQKEITVLPQTESTNTLAKAAALNGCDAGSCFVASKQTAGRGRLGRNFASPDGGIYLSMVLRPTLCMQDSVSLTTCAAVAVCRAIEKICGVCPKIKWVNDIFLNDKKLCGILTEAAANIETATLDYAIIGIGINFFLNKKYFPTQLHDIITGIYPNAQTAMPDGILRTRLVAEVLNTLYELEQTPNAPDIIAEYKQRCFVLSKQITVLSSPPRTAVAEDITDNCNLVVRYPDGEKQVLTSGEISILPN